MRYGVRVLCAGAALALLAGPLSGCGGGGKPAAGGTPASSASGPAATSSAGTSGTASCSDASDPRLQNVTLAADAAGLTATWTSTGTDRAASAIWEVTVSGGPPNDYQLTVKETGGAAQSYVFNGDTSAQVQVHQSGGVTVTATSTRETFPWADLSGIGSDFTWNAVLNIDGTDVAYCPGDLTFLAFQH